MTTVDVLTSARDLIARPNGWCKGFYHCVMPDPTAAHPSGEMIAYCAIGAIEAAASDGLKWSDLIYTLQLGIGVSQNSIASWNDDPSRTQQDVIAAFDRAIAIARDLEVDRG